MAEHHPGVCRLRDRDQSAETSAPWRSQRARPEEAYRLPAIKIIFRSLICRI